MGGGRLSDNLLMEGRLRVENGWKGNKRMRVGRKMVKVCDLNVTSRTKGFQSALKNKYDIVRGQGLGNDDEE